METPIEKAEAYIKAQDPHGIVFTRRDLMQAFLTGWYQAASAMHDAWDDGYEAGKMAKEKMEEA